LKDCEQIADIVEDKLQKDRYVNIEIRRVTIHQTIQNTLNSLEKDCDQIADIVEDKLQKDR